MEQTLEQRGHLMLDLPVSFLFPEVLSYTVCHSNMQAKSMTSLKFQTFLGMGQKAEWDGAAEGIWGHRGFPLSNVRVTRKLDGILKYVFLTPEYG